MDDIEQIKKKMMDDILKESSKGNGWPTGPVEVTDANFNEFIGKYPISVVDCWAPWCGPCRMITPIVEELAAENAGAVKVGKLNIDESGKTAQQFGINSIPTLLLFKNGEVAERWVGVQAKSRLQEALDTCHG